MSNMQTGIDKDWENSDIGGESFIQVKDIKAKTEFVVVGLDCEETKWGNKIIFKIANPKGEIFLLTSWNISTEKKFKPKDVLGKTVFLSPKNEKKVSLTW